MPVMTIATRPATRRTFLRSAAGLGALSARPLRAFAEPARTLTTPADFKARLRGPILSFPTCFTADYKLDLAGMRRMIDGAVRAGVGVVALTAGNGMYAILTYDEIKSLTRMMVEAVAGRALTIAATGSWWTGQSEDYARFAESLGADAVQVLMAPRADDDGHVAHYRAVAAATRLGIVIHGGPTVALVKRLATIDSVVAIKAEFPVETTTALYQELGDRINIFQGGQKSHFLAYHPYGMRAYYSIYSTFAPEQAMTFWKSVQAGDLDAARAFALKYDIPLFRRFSHAFWRATIEHFGVAERHLRPPDRGFDEKEMEGMREFYRALGIGPKRA
jgi:dihydrodipicolinate synthase/N-acetylneuraminate lyase